VSTAGWIKLYRKLTQSEIWYKPPAWLKVWVYILLSINHQGTSAFPRGTGHFQKDWEGIPGVTKWQWQDCIEYLRKTQMIRTRKTTRGIVVTVTRYNEYQNALPPQTNTQTNSRPTFTQPDTRRKKEGRRKHTLPSQSRQSNQEHETLVNRLADVYKTRFPAETKRYGLRKAREVFLELLMQGKTSEEIEQAIKESKTSKPWEILPLKREVIVEHQTNTLDKYEGYRRERAPREYSRKQAGKIRRMLKKKDS